MESYKPKFRLDPKRLVERIGVANHHLFTDQREAVAWLASDNLA